MAVQCLFNPVIFIGYEWENVVFRKGESMNEIVKRKKKFYGPVAIVLAVALMVTCFLGFSDRTNAGTLTANVSTHGARLNVRSGPSTDYRILTRLNNGTAVTVIGSSGSWYQIRYGSGNTGYVYGQYLKFAGDNVTYPVTARVTEGGVPLNLRKSPTTSSAILDKIPRGSSIKITGKYNSSWYSASYNGKNGYVSADYIIMPGSSGSSSSAGTSSTSGPGGTYRSISLKVTNYSQFDPAWADMKLGNSSATIAQSGCVVCGLAQIETYLSGRPITPADMVKKLSFDSEGRVYWPSGYVSYSGSSYLSAIYKQLDAGNPVLVGGFTSSGKQHWVVVTGYNKNGSSLSASNFTVNDCSGRYSTLSSYFSTYSRFYKIVYKN